MPRSNASYLRWKLGQWARAYAPNITMLEEHSPAPPPLEPGEQPIAQVSLTIAGSPIVVTDARLVRDRQTILRYDDLQRCIWIDRDRELRVKLKHSHFQRMILERTDNSELVLDGLGLAVFPLLQFFWFKLDRREVKAR